MLAAALALASSACWGVSDFLGGLQSRRHALLGVMVLSQGTALVILGVIALTGVAPTGHDGEATLYAAVSGTLGIIALTAFYRALTLGSMSIVAPISATGTVIPVLVGLAGGERPSAIQLAGIALAGIGVVLAAREVPSEDAGERRDSRTAILLALLAAVGFGSFFAGMDHAEEHGELVWVMLAARTPAVALLVLACLVMRPTLPLRRSGALPAIAVIGVLDLAANTLFVAATGQGLLSVVGVLGSLYPVVTVLLARVVLDERLSSTQNAGVLLTLTGVVGLAAG